MQNENALIDNIVFNPSHHHPAHVKVPTRDMTPGYPLYSIIASSEEIQEAIIPLMLRPSYLSHTHDDVIKWKHFLRYWPFVWGIHR